MFKRNFKMNKNIITTILIICIIALACLSYYFYSKAMECKELATGLGARLQECGAGIEQYKAGVDQYKAALEQCMAQATQCQQALGELMQ